MKTSLIAVVTFLALDGSGASGVSRASGASIGSTLAAPDKGEVVLERGIHFDTGADVPVLLPPGTYGVDYTGQKIALIAPNGSRTVVDAVWGTHPALLEETLPLAIPGEGEQSDVGFIVVLLPGGSMLEASGTYSGVSRRGILDRLQNSRIGQAAQKAGAKIQEVAGNVKEKVGEVKENLTEALSAVEIQQLVQGIQDLGLRALVRCIATPGGANDVALVGYINQLKNNGPEGFFRFVGDDVANRLDSKFQILLAKDLERLRKGEDLPGMKQLVDEGFSKIEALCKDRKGTRCLYEFMEPKLPALKNAITKLHEEAQTRIRTTFEKQLAPALYDGVIQKLMPVLDPDWTMEPRVSERGLQETMKELEHLSKWKERAMASGFYAQSLTEQLKKSTEELKKALASNDPAAARAALATTEAWTDQAALEYALDIIRFRGHETLEKGEGSKVVEKALSTLEVSKDLSAKIKDAVCGLVPEAGGAVCAFLEAPLRVLWNYVGRKALKDFVSKLVHSGWELVVQKAETHLLGKAAAAEPGPLGVLATQFTRERVLAAVEKTIPDTRPALKAYNDELRTLITKWEQKK